MKLTNKHNLPQAIVNAAQPYPKVEGRIGVTTLIAPPLQRFLTFKHWDDIEQDVVDFLWALKGSATHSILEQNAPKSSIAEMWLEVKLGQFTVVGVVDLYTPLTGLLEDYKEKSVWSFTYGDTYDIERQLNCNAWLAEQHNLPVESLRGVYILRDWSRNRVSGNYPTCPVHVVDFPLWSRSQADSYVNSRIAEHAKWTDFSGPTPPVCPERDRWAKDDTWAVMKKGRKSALRVLNTEAEAIEWQKNNGGDSIEHRQGDKWAKCHEWCSVAPFCPYYQEAMKCNTETSA